MFMAICGPCKFGNKNNLFYTINYLLCLESRLDLTRFLFYLLTFSVFLFARKINDDDDDDDDDRNYDEEYEEEEAVIIMTYCFEEVKKRKEGFVRSKIQQAK